MINVYQGFTKYQSTLISRGPALDTVVQIFFLVLLMRFVPVNNLGFFPVLMG